MVICKCNYYIMYNVKFIIRPFSDYTHIIIEYFAHFIEQNEKAWRIINSPFCRRCPEEDSGRTREVIAVKYRRVRRAC